MSAKSKGTERERDWRDRLRAGGWTVVRPGASLGPADLVAMAPSSGRTLVLFEQVKGNTGSPWMNFRPPERRELLKAARTVNAIPRLIHWPPHGEPRIYEVDDWPKG